MLKTHPSLKMLAMLAFIQISSISIAQAGSSETTPRRHITAGMAIYLGLLPAEMIEGHTATSMHGGLPTGSFRYHLAIAIFDDKTGRRINNARVLVRINNRIGVGPDSFIALEAMKMNDQYMYGNYFLLKTAGPYRIDVKILRGKAHKPVQVSFDYDFAHT